MWRGFGPGPQSNPRRLGGLAIAGRRAVLMLQARRFRCEAVLCSSAASPNASPTTSSRLGRVALLGSNRLSIVWRLPLEVGRRRVSHAAENIRSATTPCCAPWQTGPRPRTPGDHRDRQLGLASQPSLRKALSRRRACGRTRGRITERMKKISYSGYRFPPRSFTNRYGSTCDSPSACATSKICWRNAEWRCPTRRFGVG